MPVKLFVLGRPGCGKSRTSVHLTKIVRAEGWDARRFKDYDILAKMAQDGDERLRITPSGGFDVLDTAAFDEALSRLEEKVREYYQNIEIDKSISKELAIIEIARGNYQEAFTQFRPDFLKDAYFLLIDAEFEMCRERIRKRMLSPLSSDDHDVSDFAMNEYYKEQHLPRQLTSHIKIVKNNGDWYDFTRAIEPFIKDMLKIH